MNVMVFAKTALKNLFSTPATKMYPQVPAQYPERTRGHVTIDIDTCIFCGICQRKCPTGAIKVDRPSKSWSIEPYGCVQCANCVECCPKKCLGMGTAYTTPGGEKKIETHVQPPKPEQPAAPASAAPAPSQAASSAAAPAAESTEYTMVEVDMAQCILCGLCGKKCPVDVITVDRAAKTWSINRDECILCENCISACPKKCMTMQKSAAQPAGTDTRTKAVPEATPKASAAPASAAAPADEAKGDSKPDAETP